MSTDAERMVIALRFANYTRVSEALGVTRSAVARWAKGRQVTPWNLSQVEALLERKEEAAPDWERLQRQVDAIAEKLGVSLDEEQAAVGGVDETLPRPPGAGSAQDQPEDGLAGEARPDTRGR